MCVSVCQALIFKSRSRRRNYGSSDSLWADGFSFTKIVDFRSFSFFPRCPMLELSIVRFFTRGRRGWWFLPFLFSLSLTSKNPRGPYALRSFETNGHFRFGCVIRARKRVGKNSTLSRCTVNGWNRFVPHVSEGSSGSLSFSLLFFSLSSKDVFFLVRPPGSVESSCVVFTRRPLFWNAGSRITSSSSTFLLLACRI